MTKAFRKFDPALPVLEISVEEKRNYFVSFRSYTKSTSLEPKKLLLCADECSEQFNSYGQPDGLDANLAEYRLKISALDEERLPQAADKLLMGEFFLIDILRNHGFEKGKEVYLSRKSERLWRRYKSSLAAKGINVRDADIWHEKEKEIKLAMCNAKQEWLKKQDEEYNRRNNFDTWHEEVADYVLNKKGGRVLVAYTYKGEIYHKAYLDVSRYKVTNQGFSGSAIHYSGDGPRNVVFYP